MKKSFYHLRKQVLSLSAVIICTLLFTNQAFSQQGVSVNITGTAPDGSAILDLASTTKGFLVPRMSTAQRDLIGSPAQGLLIYNTTTTQYNYYEGGWQVFGGGGAPIAGNDIHVVGSIVHIDDDETLNYIKEINPTNGDAGGPADLTFDVPLLYNIIFQANNTEYARLSSSGNFGIGDNSPVAALTVGSGDKFQVNSTGDMDVINSLTGYDWPAAHAAGVLKNAGTGVLTWTNSFIDNTAGLPANNIWIGDGAGLAQEAPMIGDATISFTSPNAVLDLSNNAVETAEIQDDAVTFAKMQNITGPAVIGKPAAGAGDPTTITATANNQVLRYDGTNVGFGIAPITGFSAGAWKVFYSDASGIITEVALGSASQALVSNGPAIAPTFQAVMSNPMTDIGDIIYGGTNAIPSTPTRLAFGTGFLKGNGNAPPTWSAVNLASADVTGILPLANGGTNANLTAVNGGLVWSNGTQMQITPAGNPGDILLSTGAGAPVFTAPDQVYWKVGGNTATVPGTGAGQDYVGTTDGQDFVVATAGTERMRVDGAGADVGNVYIGTAGIAPTPNASLLHIGVNANSLVWAETLQNKSLASSTGIGVGLKFKLSDGGTTDLEPFKWVGIAGLSTGASGANTDMIFYTTRFDGTLIGLSPEESMRITAGGASGVPGNVIVKGKIQIEQGGVGLTNGFVLQSNAAGLGTWVNPSSLTGLVTADNGLNVNTGNNVRLGGTLLVNTTVDNDALTLTLGGAAATGAITVGSSTAAQALNLGTGSGLSTVNIATGAAANVVNINNGASAGTVQIGNNNKMTITNLGVGVGGLATATNALFVNGKVKSTGINETSDARLKMNIASIDGALSKVLSMNGKYYDWRLKEFPNRGLEEGRQVGVIAQEIEAILPEVVVTDDDGFKSVEYGHIVPVLIEAIKEQQKIIDGQNTTITDLKASLETILNRVNIIEKNADLNSSKVEK